MARRFGSSGAFGALGVIAVSAIAVITLAGCGSSSSSSGSKTGAPPTVAPTGRPIPVSSKPAGPNPSKSAVMVCATEAQKDIAETLNVPATRVTTPTWIDHVYSCQYVYPDGAITLSVKELSSAAETKAYFNQLGQTQGRRPSSVKLGQGEFRTNNGSIVARKDYKVLEVDVSMVPHQFGPLHLAPNVVAIDVGETIMGCWSGA